MTFEQYLQKPGSKKIVMTEFDTAIIIDGWINSDPGIWNKRIKLSTELVSDDRGNFGYYTKEVQPYKKIGSVVVNGISYTKVSDYEDLKTTEQSFYFDSATTDLYVRFLDAEIPYFFISVKPGEIIGITDQVDRTVNNYFDNLYYDPKIRSIPNLSKSKDSVFFGKLQFPSVSVNYDNTDGTFDNLPEEDLYGQPFRIKLSFEGLPYEEALTVYTGRIDRFTVDDVTLSMNLLDPRKLISRSLPVNSFNLTDHPGIDEETEGLPIPLIFGEVIKVPAYRVAAGQWIFADTEFYQIDFGITVYKEDGSIFTHGGTETDGSFTGVDTDENLYVSCKQSAVINGLDVISSLNENYNNITFGSASYDVAEWNSEKTSIKDMGLWIGADNILSIVRVIEQVCTDNQGVFDVLADGRYSFRSFDPNKTPSIEFRQDDEMASPRRSYDPKEFLSSVKIEFSENWQDNSRQIYTNLDYQDDVFRRFSQYKERIVKTALSSRSDAIELSNQIMVESEVIKPIVTITTKYFYLAAKILDNAAMTVQRRSGKVIIPYSSYQILSHTLNLSNFEMTFRLKFIDNLPAPVVRTRVVKMIPGGIIKILPGGQIKTAIIEES